MEPVDRTPERQLAGGERQVEGDAGVIPGRSAVLQCEEVPSNLEEPLAGIGTAWQVADRARQGALKNAIYVSPVPNSQRTLC
ncbi:MAG: hypothetical protein OXH70_04000 [Acidobacteria bacterium]|nr:hypothetical protein [Acidobacteriota bacterium]